MANQIKHDYYTLKKENCTASISNGKTQVTVRSWVPSMAIEATLKRSDETTEPEKLLLNLVYVIPNDQVGQPIEAFSSPQERDTEFEIESTGFTSVLIRNTSPEHNSESVSLSLLT